MVETNLNLYVQLFTVNSIFRIFLRFLFSVANIL